VSGMIASSLSELLKFEKKKYLEDSAENGGTASGFRDRIRNEYATDPEKFNALVPQALMEAATKTWQAPPRKNGPDLFSIAGLMIPESLTRLGDVVGDEITADDEEKFEKGDCNFATVDDLYEDAAITMRKGKQVLAAGERKMRVADEARSRAHGNRKAFLPLRLPSSFSPLAASRVCAARGHRCRRKSSCTCRWQSCCAIIACRIGNILISRAASCGMRARRASQ
jgi:hypothetical protein